jgi:hypothetical protein
MLMFFASWLVLSLFSHKVRDLLILLSHLHRLRTRRISILGVSDAQTFPFSYEDDHRYVPKFLFHLPVIFFVGSLLLLLSSTTYLLVLCRMSFSAALVWGLSLMTFVSLFFHQAIIAYFKHFRAGTCCITAKEIMVYESAYQMNYAWLPLSRFPRVYRCIRGLAHFYVNMAVAGTALILTGNDLTARVGDSTNSIRYQVMLLGRDYAYFTSQNENLIAKWPLVTVAALLVTSLFWLKWFFTKKRSDSAHKAALRSLENYRQVKWTPKVGQRGTVSINTKGTVQHVQETTPA